MKSFSERLNRVDEKIEAERLKAEQENAEQERQLAAAVGELTVLQPRIREVVDAMVYIQQNDSEEWKNCEKEVTHKHRLYFAVDKGVDNEADNARNGLMASFNDGNTICVFNDNGVENIGSANITSANIVCSQEGVAAVPYIKEFINRFTELENTFDKWFTKTYEPEKVIEEEFPKRKAQFLDDVYNRLESYINNSDRPYAIVLNSPDLMENGIHSDKDGNEYLRFFVNERHKVEAGAYDGEREVRIPFSELDSKFLSDIFEDKEKFVSGYIGNNYNPENLSVLKDVVALRDAFVELTDKKVAEFLAHEAMLNKIYEEAAKFAEESSRPYTLGSPTFFKIKDAISSEYNQMLSFTIHDRENPDKIEDFMCSSGYFFGNEKFMDRVLTNETQISAFADTLIKQVDEKAAKAFSKEMSDKAAKADKSQKDKKNKQVERD